MITSRDRADAFDKAYAIMGFDLAIKYQDYVKKKWRLCHFGAKSILRDSDRSKTYKAENVALEMLSMKIANESFLNDEKSAQKFFKKVIKSKTYQKLCNDNIKSDNTAPVCKQPYLVINSRMKRNAGVAKMGMGVIELQPSEFGMTKYVILHELAHMCGHSDHDVGFRISVLKLVSRFMGVDAASNLKYCFKKAKLKMSVPKTFKSPEQWLESYQKMAKMREKAVA
jgi:hypothetical protein